MTSTDVCLSILLSIMMRGTSHSHWYKYCTRCLHVFMVGILEFTFESNWVSNRSRIMPNAMMSLFSSMGHGSPWPVLVFVNYGGRRSLGTDQYHSCCNWSGTPAPNRKCVSSAHPLSSRESYCTGFKSSVVRAHPSQKS